VATWELIESTGRTLVRILQNHVDTVLPLAGVQVQLATTKLFRQLETTTTPAITVFLYRATENGEMRNSPRRTLPDGTTTRPFLPLELCYLVTPWGVRVSNSPMADAQAAQEEHRLLGVALQAFYDHAEISRAELVEDPTAPVWETTDNVQLVLESLPVEDHYRIWDSGELDYRVSLTYRVRVLGLEPSRRVAEPPVVEADFIYQPGLR
jgi:uncharacterized protein DUF4255